METPPEDRLDKLEAALAHLERMCDELNQVVIAQARALARLEARQDRVSETITTIELERVRSSSTQPPHYQ